MIIKHFKTRQFAGLKDIEIDFAPGVNVILGPNEAGKSTLVAALRFGLLSPVTFKGLEKKQFEQCYLPFSGGNKVDVELTVGTDKGDLRLLKNFGHRPSVQLEVGSGAIVTREVAVYQQLNTIFGCGEKTLEILVFAQQHDFQNLFAQMTSQDLAQGFSSILHQAALELDGISVHGLENRLNQELDQLTARWDLNKGCPEGGRGIERPYQKGVGKILAAYYQREQMAKRMKQCLDHEQRASRLAQQIKELRGTITAKQQEISDMTKLEDNIIHRLELEPVMEKLLQQAETINADIREWPIAMHLRERQQERLSEVTTRLSLLKVEEEHSRERQGRQVLQDLLNKLDYCYQQEEILLAEINSLKLITDSQITEIETVNRRLEDLNISLQASQMRMRINLAADQNAQLTCDFEDLIMAAGVHDYEANRYLRLEIPGIAAIEIQSGDSDYTTLKEEYESCRSHLGGLLLGLELDSLEDARYNYQRAGAISREIDGLRIMASMLLGERTRKGVEQELTEREDLPPSRPLPEIQQEMEALIGEERRLRTGINQVQDKIEHWQTSYSNLEQASDKLREIELAATEIGSELAILDALPPTFSNAQDFRRHLDHCRSEEKLLTHELNELLAVYHDQEAVLGDEGYEDLRRQYDEIVEEHQQLIEEAYTLLRIRQVFTTAEQEVKHLAEKLFIEHFAHQVDELTAGRYGVINKPGFLEFALQQQDTYSVPFDLLSAGTMGLLALAFRFAWLGKLFPLGGGMVVLDDCLVDLDSERRRRAAAMILEWARGNQVIFVTCDPNTAELLGGKTIRLG